MDVFPGWENYVARIERAWRAKVGGEDTVVLPGDTSWGMSLEGALADFRFLEALPGRKILLKGNHDYWWSTRSKVQKEPVMANPMLVFFIAMPPGAVPS